MKSEKIDKTIKKHNKEIIGRMKKVVGVRKNTELPAKSGISGSDISHFISSNNRAFYKIIVDFCVQRSVNIAWLITGAGDKFIQTTQDTPNTPRERELVSRLLYVLRHVPDEAIKSALINLIDHYPLKYSGVAQDSADTPVRNGGDRSNEIVKEL